MANDPHVKRLLWFVFAGTRGGVTRLKLIKILKKTPLNSNQLSLEMKLDYKTIQHHIKFLLKNNIIEKMGEKYNVIYFLSTFLEINIESLDEVILKLGKSK